MKYNFTPKGVCSRQIDIETEGGKIIDVKFTGGCNGNLKAMATIGSLIDGLRKNSNESEEAISKLENIHCGMKNTSCPDQLAKALKQTL